MGGQVSLSVTAWRLTDRSGTPTNCVISERDGRWHLIVRRGSDVVFSERCGTDDAALGRANEIWRVLRDQGWTEPMH